jgi:PPOX class probable F420-dependent enzyme
MKRRAGWFNPTEDRRRPPSGAVTFVNRVTEEIRMATVPQEYRDLLDERPVLVSLATVQPDGQPQVTPVWIDMEGDLLRVNTVKGRQKYVNMDERPMVTVLAIDPDNAFRYIEVRGHVTKITEEGGNAHIDTLAKKYTGADVYPWHNDTDTRVVVYVEPTKVFASG